MPCYIWYPYLLTSTPYRGVQPRHARKSGATNGVMTGGAGELPQGAKLRRESRGKERMWAGRTYGGDNPPPPSENQKSVSKRFQVGPQEERENEKKKGEQKKGKTFVACPWIRL